MNEITSVQNNLVKETVKLHQKKYREDLILLEGLKAVEGAILSNLKIKYIISDDKKTAAKYKNYDIYLASEAVMKRRIQGGVIDPKHDTVWVTLRHDEERREASIEIRDRAPWEGGRLLAATGVSGR